MLSIFSVTFLSIFPFQFLCQIHIAHAIVLNSLLQVRIQDIRIPQPFVFKRIKSDFNHMLFICAF